MLNKKFVSTENKGFQITFGNGVIASVQWGAGNYCDNHFPADGDFSYRKSAQSNTAEVAAIDSQGNFITASVCPDAMEDVMGYLSPEEVLEFLNQCKNYRTNN